MSERGEPDPAQLDIAGLFDRVEQTLLGGPRHHTRAEVSELTGVPPDETRRLWQELGFATVGDDDAVFTDSDVQALRRVRFLAENGLGEDDLRHAMARMLGQTFARLASSQGQLLVDLITGSAELLSSEDSIAELVDKLIPAMEEIQAYVWRRQLVAYFSRVASRASSEITQPSSKPIVVGFADLSGFTSLTRRTSEVDLRDLLEAFEFAATEVVGGHDGRIVKTIGDEVLFVADEPADGAEIALSLLEAVQADDRLPPLRVGIAAGPVLSRLGDVYGSTVNIASRLTSLSRPGWVLVDRVMAETLREDGRFTLRPRRAESVRGYRHLRQWRLGRAAGGSGGSRERGAAHARRTHRTVAERAVGQH